MDINIEELTRMANQRLENFGPGCAPPLKIAPSIMLSILAAITRLQEENADSIKRYDALRMAYCDKSEECAALKRELEEARKLLTRCINPVELAHSESFPDNEYGELLKDLKVATRQQQASIPPNVSK